MPSAEMRRLLELVEAQAAGCAVDRDEIRRLAARLAERDTDMRAVLLNIHDQVGNRQEGAAG